MSLSWECFKDYSKQFLSYSIKTGNQWEWIESSNYDYGNGYLRLSSHIVNDKIFHVHIVYSISYSCPVLYFNVYEFDGQLVSLMNVWKLLKLNDLTEDDLWKTVTQGDHPHLHIPYYMIHPCETTLFISEIMKNTNPSYYLLTWLSLYGSIIHLNCEDIRNCYLNK